MDALASVVDMHINANFTENVPFNTRAFALVISDKMLSLKSDGNKLSVVYYKNLNMHLIGINILRFIKIQLIL